jgi:tRNA pseudouridine55 synthase
MKIDINGVLLLNKPPMISSNIALQKVKRIYNAKKAGHTGTLDPLATGLLPICFGEATKFSSFLLDADKEYIARIKLGESTTTYDSCGDVIESKKVTSNSLEINEVIQTFLGEITQIPPIYSALKVNGKRLYEYARNGEEVEIKSRQIKIKELEIIEELKDNVFTLRVLCSKGTYIRTLAHDIGLKLGCGAHLIGLVRSKSSGFKLDTTINLESLAQMSHDELLANLLPVDELVKNLVRYDLNVDEYAYIKNGRSFKSAHNDKMIDILIRLYYQNVFLGVSSVINGEIVPKRLMSNNKYGVL